MCDKHIPDFSLFSVIKFRNDICNVTTDVQVE